VTTHLSDRDKALYADAMRLERTGKLPGTIRTHVSQCEQCKKEILDLLELTDGVPYSAEGTHPYFDRAREPRTAVWVRAWRIAAVLAAAIGIGLIWDVLTPFQEQVPPRSDITLESESTGPVLPETTATDQSTSPGTTAGDLASRFEPSPNLEDLVGMPLRSVSTAGFRPAVGAVLTNPVRLSWEATLRGPYRLSILDNRDRTLVDTTLGVSRLVLPGRLGAGLYYWKLVAGGKLQFVSKFSVREP
jgi:hypothetical protein